LIVAGVTTVERAYQLARSGQYPTVETIKKRLQDEGFGDANGQLTGRTLTTDLRRLINAAHRESEPPQ
jgi:hypothetical protein